MTQPTQMQIQVVACNSCGLMRNAQPIGASKLTLVGATQQISPCPFCLSMQEMMENMNRLAAAVQELQGMAMPEVVEAPVQPRESQLVSLPAADHGATAVAQSGKPLRLKGTA